MNWCPKFVASPQEIVSFIHQVPFDYREYQYFSGAFYGK